MSLMKKLLFSVYFALFLIILNSSGQSFISYNPSGYKQYTSIIVYLPYPNTKYYAGFGIGHCKDTSTLVFSNQYRLLEGYQYQYEGGKMIKTDRQILISAESESVYKAKNRADFSGGWHGDEQLQQLRFYLDGKPYQFTSKVELLPCKEFRYEQESTIHETAKTINGVVTPNPLHPVEAKHFKNTSFKNTGYETFNRLTWQNTVDVDFWFMGIACVGKASAMTLYNEKDKIKYNYTGGGKTPMNNVKGAKEVFYANDSTGLSAHVTSTLLLPKNQDENCVLKVWDRAKDSKYYRSYKQGKNPEKGEVWESRMTVSFFSKSN